MYLYSLLAWLLRLNRCMAICIPHSGTCFLLKFCVRFIILLILKEKLESLMEASVTQVLNGVLVQFITQSAFKKVSAKCGIASNFFQTIPSSKHQTREHGLSNPSNIFASSEQITAMYGSINKHSRC